MAGILQTLIGSLAGVAKDTFFRYVSLLLSGNSPGGTVAPYNADASTNNFNVVQNGDVRNATFSPFNAGYYSGYFDGAGDYLTLPSGAAWTFGTGAFSVECWIYPTSASSGAAFSSAVDGSGTIGVTVYTSAGSVYGEIRNSSGAIFAANTTFSSNTWLHVVICRDSSTNTAVFVNGTRIGSGTNTSNVATTTFIVGALYTNTALNPFLGYISNLRVVKGSSAYDPTQTTLTVPTTPLTAITNTSLLTCQSNRFIDNSTNAFAITRNGDVAVSSAQPFTLPAANVPYGAGFFDGTGDYLAIPANAAFNFGTGAFTLECWAYRTGAGSGDRFLIDQQNGVQYTLRYNASGVLQLILLSGVALSYTFTMAIGEWYHIVAVRSGSSLALFVNGVRQATGTSSSSIGSNTEALAVGAKQGGGTDFFAGYISNVRIVKGTAVYDPSLTTLTVPTAPLTAITNTSLLTCQSNIPSANSGFLDGSTNNFTITRNGNTTQGTFTPYGSNWSNYFDGNGDYLSIGSNAVLAPGTGDFWIEAWVSFGALPASNAIANVFQNDVLTASSNDKFWFGLFNNAGTNQLAVGRHNTSTRASVNWTPTIGVWYHVAAARASGTTYLFIDGVSQSVTGSTNFNGVSFGQAGAVIGAVSTPQYLTGYLSNVRYIVGAALYTATFTVPTAPLTTTSQGASSSQVEILICQSNRFVDNSTNAFAITRNGDVSVQRFSPFSPTDAYSTSVIGGSGYFDGAGDYLDAPNNAAFNFGSGNFTIEFWVNTTRTADSWITGYYVSNPGGTAAIAYEVLISGGVYYLNLVSGATETTFQIGTTGQLSDAAWHHIACTRDGNTVRTFRDGALITSATYSSTLNNPGSAIYRVGGFSGTFEDPFAGYISSLRVVKGTAVYTAAFTPPTSPLAAITNTSLLLNFTNAGIIDNAMMNDLETVGNAQISTTQSKFGGSSMYFDGTGDYLTSNAPSGLALYSIGANEQFTVEMWVYRVGNGTGGSATLDAIIGSNNGAFSIWGVYVNRSTRVISFNNSAGLSSTSGSITDNTWTHIAVTRDSSNTLRIFINGVSGFSGSNTGTGTLVNPLYIGRDGTGASGNSNFNGYIDDLRITKGVARYTANFTPPAAAFPTS